MGFLLLKLLFESDLAQFADLDFFLLFELSLFEADLSNGLVLCLDILLKLVDLERGLFEVSSELRHLIVGLNQVLRVEVSVRSDCLVKSLLLLELSFELDVLLLELTDQVCLELHFFDHLHQVGVGLACLERELVSLLFKSVDLLEQVSDVLLLISALDLEVLDLSVLGQQFLLVLLVLDLGLLDVLLHHVSVSDQIQDRCFFVVALLSQMLDFSRKGIDTCLGDGFLVLGLLLELGDPCLLSNVLIVASVQYLVFLLELSELVLVVGDFLFAILQLVLQRLVLSQARVVVSFQGVVLLVQSIELGLQLLAVGLLVGAHLSQSVDLALLLLVVGGHLVDLIIGSRNLLLQVLLLFLEKLCIAIELDVFLIELLDLVLDRMYLLFLLQQLRLQSDDLLVLLDPDSLQVVNLLFLLLDLVLEFLLLSHKSLNLVVLTHRETRALLNDLMKLADLVLESLDDFPGFLLLSLGSFDEFPALVDLPSEHADGVRVFLSELDGSLDSGCVLQNSVVKFSASLHQPLFALVGCLQGSVKFLVFLSELLHGLVADQLLQDLLEILFKSLILSCVDSHLGEVVVHLSACACGISHSF